MIAAELISYEIPPLKPSDTGSKVLQWMEEFKVKDMVVVKSKKYIGIIEETDLLDRNNIEDKLETYSLDLKKPFVFKNQHIFEVIGLFVEFDVDVLPVLNENSEYLGLITSKKILQYLSEIVSVANQGSIITLEMNAVDYSMAEIAKIVESDDAKILASFITSHPDTTKIEVTLKINKTDITRVLHTFDRFNYTVTASFNESEYHQDLKNRYDEFMRFLNP
ncbi:MAG: CBS domain-containing protein [Flavobacteriales bacterium]|nr:CBS domain-containing protein [Flavobacteriales bacterium]MCB9174890.1 CBS domain-containing protein [Flavobacteriales bacterium]